MKKTILLWCGVLVFSIALAPMAQAQDQLPLWSSVDVQFYGFIKLDAAYDTHRTSVGNFARWVESDHLAQNDDQFNMTANQTRFGLRLTGPTEGVITTRGLLEFDFYGNGVAENKPGLLLRHAYLEFHCAESDMSLLAGQTSDVISPLYPSTINYTVGWWTGNPGYRRPQIRLTKGFELDQDVNLEIIGAATRTIGDAISAFDPGDTGEDAGIPTFQSRVGLTFPLLEGQITSVGVSAHWGQEECDIDHLDHCEKYDSWSLNVDLVQPINDWLTFKGEFFTGENLATYLAGIGQGINVALDDEIGATGGWVTATMTPIEDWSFNIGAMMDDVRANDVPAGSRTLNNAIFANAIYNLNAKTQVGLEVTKWHTERKREGSADSIRTQLAFIYKF